MTLENVTVLEVVGTVTVAAWLATRVIPHLPALLVSSASIKGADHHPSVALLAYLHERARHWPLVGRRFKFERIDLEGGDRRTVPFWATAPAVGLYWLGWRPILVRAVGSKDDQHGGNWQVSYELHYLRGTVDWDRLLQEAADWHDRSVQETSQGRFRVHRVAGMTRPVGSDSNQSEPAREVGVQERGGRDLWVPIGTDWSEIHQRTLHAGPDDMSLTAEQLRAVDRVRQWFRSRDWYRQHGIPWKMGLNLTGPPGCGKSSLVRCLAAELQIPIYQYELATMTSASLLEEWEKMLRDSPCVALFEDFDTVFHERKEQKGVMVNFGTVLNAIDGVGVTDGVLTIITTNRPELVDSAMMRRGRIDLQVPFGSIDHPGRLKMARRILGPGPDADRIAAELGDCSGADFQDECVQRALALRWG